MAGSGGGFNSREAFAVFLILVLLLFSDGGALKKTLQAFSQTVNTLKNTMEAVGASVEALQAAVIVPDDTGSDEVTTLEA
ncbi:hypothetical protein [Calderihabitans maritimus]|uniref:Uncharacterized protein n=1 Tax=Calderihabitans maritimus TaxID=1246530 RepID=A0A1Z5HMW9_9FIRM|nr:hypothetical protein [Calderihabitans maritimus]GAW90859.1 hypothetical protein KKC1_00210 [Calderihabitans maritimus]